MAKSFGYEFPEPQHDGLTVSPCLMPVFVQVKVSAVTARARALAVIRSAHSPQLDFIALAIQGRQLAL